MAVIIHRYMDILLVCFSTVYNRNISVHDTEVKNTVLIFGFTSGQKRLLFMPSSFVCIVRRCGTPSFCSSSPSPSLDEGEGSLDSEGGDFDDEREDCVGEERGDCLDSGWMLFGVFFKTDESNVDEEEV